VRHNPPMSLETVQNLNWVDWALGLILIGYVIAGIRRGFVMGVMDLLGMVVSLGAAILGYHQAATLLLQTVEIPSAIAYIGAFLGIVIVAQVVFTALVNLLFHVGRPVMIALGPISSLDKALGAFPGIVKGIIFSTLLLLPFALYPLVPQISAGVERSELGSRIVVAAIDTAPDLESLMGREITEGIGFLSPPQTDEGMKLNFGPVGKLVPDPAAEQKMFKMVNQERAKAGLRPLQWDEQLSQVARGHSMEMFQMGYFAHNSPVSGTPFDRMRQAGIAFLVAGENLAYAPNVQIAHEGLMNSPGHRANILRPEFGKIGIGVIESDFRGSMFSQEFTN
jgi:uncharacterized membrane protein required for colicin V production